MRTARQVDVRADDVEAIAFAQAELLARRLRMLADEIESADRYGVPIPHCVTVSGHEYGGASFSATHVEFDAWAAYCVGAEVTEGHHHGSRWLSVDRVDVNGLPLSFSVALDRESA